MQRMSGLDASFLYLETPAMPMHVGLLVVLDPPATGYDYAAVFRQIEAAAQCEPTLSLQVAEVPFSVDHPRWVQADELDVLHHVRRVTCPGDGSMEDLCGVVDRALATPLDRARPLWEVWVIEGLSAGRYALLAKVHHALTDGIAGMQLLASIFQGDKGNRATPANDIAPSSAEDRDPLSLLSAGLRSRLGTARELVRLVKRTRDAVEAVFERRREEPSRQGGTLLRAPRAPWNQPITRERVSALCEIRTDDIRDVRKALGVSANDLLLAICAGALRRYLIRHGSLPAQSLTAACPVATRVDRAARNRISGLVVTLGTDLADPIERARYVAGSAEAAREEHSSLGADMLASWAELVTPNIARGAVRLYAEYGVSAHHPPIYNLSISNVPGPRKPLSFVGGSVRLAYPLGPVVDGVGLNITMLSYAGVYSVGIVAARSVFPNLHELPADIHAAVSELDAATALLRKRVVGAEKR